MGISFACAQLLVEEHRRRPFTGSVVELGRQDCAFDARALARWARARGAPLRDEPARKGRPDDRAFFRMLGFDEVASLDVSDFEGATHVADLNHPVPEALHGRYDVVFNGGTLEHVFDLRASLANVHRLLRTGGRAIHLAPASNMLDHGFYSFSPTLFVDYYTANDWRVVTAYLFQARDWESRWTVYRYEPGALDAIASRFHDVRATGITMAGLWVVVEKTESSTCDAVPQQGQYVRRWAQEAAPRPDEPTGLARAVRDAKRRLDRALPVINPRVLPPRVGVFG